MTTDHQLFAVTASGPEFLLAVAEGARLHGILEGLPPAVYSALRTFHHDRFLGLDAHLDRIGRNLQALAWRVDFDRVAFRRALHAVVSVYPGADARVRFDVLSEPAASLGTSSQVLIALSPFEPVPEAFVREGVGIGLTTELRRERPRIKTTDFVRRRRPYPLLSQECYEHLMVDREGRMLECTSSNFFGVCRGALRTAGEGVLEGITREIFVQLAAGLGTAVELEAPRVDEIGALDEAFLTSSTRALVPVVRIGGTSVRGGRPGPLSRRLLEAYRELAEREAMPAVDFQHPVGASARVTHRCSERPPSGGARGAGR